MVYQIEAKGCSPCEQVQQAGHPCSEPRSMPLGSGKVATVHF